MISGRPSLTWSGNVSGRFSGRHPIKSCTALPMLEAHDTGIQPR
jgi:hypothetical protein